MLLAHALGTRCAFKACGASHTTESLKLAALEPRLKACGDMGGRSLATQSGRVTDTLAAGVQPSGISAERFGQVVDRVARSDTKYNLCMLASHLKFDVHTAE